MKTRNIVGLSILGGVGVFAYALYAYAKKQASMLENYDYKIVDFKIDTLDLQSVKGEISILFSSKSDVEVVIEEFYLDFYFNGEKVGYLEDATPFVLPAQGSTIIPLKYTLNPQLVFGNISDIISYTFNQKDAGISIRGYARLKSGFIKATLPIEYNTTIKEIMK
jgi:LEA14-like dessication related protein